MELQDVHSKLDALLARIPLDFQIQGPDPLRPPYAPVASLPPPLHGTSVASHGTTPQPLPSNLNNPDLLTVVPRATGTHRCMAGDKMRTLRLGNGYVIAWMSLLHLPPPSQTTSLVSTACGMIPACIGTKTLFSRSSATQLLLSIGLSSTHDGKQGTGTHSKHNLGTGRSVIYLSYLLLFLSSANLIFINSRQLLSAIVRAPRRSSGKSFGTQKAGTCHSQLSFLA